MAPRDRRLVEKGEGAPLQALVDQARYHLGLAEQHASALAEANWQASQTVALRERLAELDTEKHRQVAARDESKGATRAQASAISQAKQLVRRVRNIARQVVRKNPGSGVTLDQFESGPLNRVASRISGFLGKLAVPAGKLDAAFAPYFRGQSLVKLLEDAKGRLDAATAKQDVDVANLPDDTAEVYELKGEVLELIEDLNAIAKNAFDGEAELIAMFNKDILNRGRGSRKPRVEPTPPPA